MCIRDRAYSWLSAKRKESGNANAIEAVSDGPSLREIDQSCRIEVTQRTREGQANVGAMGAALHIEVERFPQRRIGRKFTGGTVDEGPPAITRSEA